MTEAEWLTCTEPREMLELIQRQATMRQLRLDACGCCRQIKPIGCHYFDDVTLWNAVETSERYADDPALRSELRAASVSSAKLRISAIRRLRRRQRPIGQEYWRFADQSYGARLALLVSRLHMSVVVARELSQSHSPHMGDNFAEPSYRCDLLRHIFGNPFRPYPVPPAPPSSVIDLAKAVYDQQPNNFALHDALLDAGHPELAEHFRDAAEWHPKGCWALDRILGKS